MSIKGLLLIIMALVALQIATDSAKVAFGAALPVVGKVAFIGNDGECLSSQPVRPVKID